MANDQEQLVLSISADVRQMQRALNRMIGDSSKATQAVVNQFNAMGTSTEGALDRTANAATRSFTRVRTSAAGIGAAMKVSQFQTANLAAQINDIGVQLASGTSPFQIAIQQGTQINQVLGRQGARGAVAALGGALVSLVNPVSLATFAFIGLGGAAIQYFTGVLSDGAKSAEELKKQRDVIRQVAKEWGDALPALKAYADELDRIESRQNAVSATATAVADAWKPVNDQIGPLNAGLADAVNMMDQIGSDPTLINDLQKAFAELADKIDDGTASGEDAARVVDLLGRSGLPLVSGLADEFSALGLAIETAAKMAAALNAEIGGAIDPMRQFREAQAESLKNLEGAQQAGAAFVAEQQRLNSLSAEQLALEAEIARIKKEASESGAVITAGEAKALAEQRLAAEEARKASSKGRSDAADAAEKERQAVSDLIDELAFELSLIGLSDQERRTAIELRRAGAAATEEQRAQIVSTIQAINDETDALAANSELMSTLNGLSKDVLGGFISDLRNGTDAAEALQNALDKVLDKLLEIALNNLFPSGGGGILGALGGLLGGGSLSNSGQFKASGGVGLFASGGVSRKPAIFGESGPEAAVPLPDGRRIPVDLRIPAIGSGSGKTHISLDLSPDLEARILTRADQNADITIRKNEGRIANNGAALAAANLAKGRNDRTMNARYNTRAQPKRI